MSRSFWILVGGLIAAITAAVLLVPRSTDCGQFACPNNLRQIGGLLEVRRIDGRLVPLPGPAFLLQVRDDLVETDRVIFFCPGDPAGDEVRTTGEIPDAILCSYAGPDLATARAFVEGTLPAPVLIACDREAFHDTGVNVLWSTGKVEFLRWKEIAGAENGDVVPIGPDAPDPRFRHLVR